VIKRVEIFSVYLLTSCCRAVGPEVGPKRKW